MKPYRFREEESPKFKLRSATLIAVLLLALLFFLFNETNPFQLSAEELAQLELQRLDQERDMTFRFIEEPEDDVELEDPDFLSDADREKKSQEEVVEPENEDPISMGDTYELAKPTPQASNPTPPSPPQVAQEQTEPSMDELAPDEPEEPTEEVEEPSEVEPTEEPLGEVEQESRGQVPTDPGAPKPFRRLSERERQEIRQQAQREMSALALSEAMKRETRAFDNPRGSSAPRTGLSIETARSDLGDYLKRLQQLVEANWRVPNIAKYEVSGVAVVYFKIAKDGKIFDASIVSESGHQPLDASSLNAILNTYQAPPLPAHVEEDWIPLRFGFYYNMRPRYR